MIDIVWISFDASFADNSVMANDRLLLVLVVI